jgi:sporulation protein YlmC with PRC-barrel domain
VADLLRDEELQGRLVVSIDGEDVAHVRGPLEDDSKEVVALQLGKTGLFGGDMDVVLPRTAVRGIGPDAVVVGSAEDFLDPAQLNGHQAGAEIRVVEDPTDIASVRPEGSVLFSEARQREVVSDEDGEPVGRVDRFVVDPDEQRIVSLRLDNVSDMQRYLLWRDITDFGDDEVRVPKAGVLRLADGPREERIRTDYGMLGKRIVTDAGHELGKVVDVAFDRTDGSIACVVLEDGEIAGDRLLGVGPYAVVVAH